MAGETVEVRVTMKGIEIWHMDAFIKIWKMINIPNSYLSTNLNEGSKKDGEEGDNTEEGIELFFYLCDFDEFGAGFCFCSGEFKYFF